MWNLLKALQKCEDEEISLIPSVKVGGNLMGQSQKLSFTAVLSPEAMLTVCEDLKLN